MPVPRAAVGEHLPIHHAQCCKQRRRSMPHVVVADAFDVAQPHRQHGLGALQRLALALLIHARNQRVLGWIEIQTRHVAQLLDEQRIGR